MDKAITTGLFIAISMIMALMLFNVTYPAVIEGSDAITSMSGRTDERLRSQLTLIHMAGELDSTGWWQDTNSNGLFETYLWVKNTGSTRMTAQGLDVFFGPEGNFSRIPHQDESDGAFPYWTSQVENASDWNPTATLKITIHYQAPLLSGRYFGKVIAPNGVFDESFLGM